MAQVQIPDTLPDLPRKSQRWEDPRLKSHIMNPPPRSRHKRHLQVLSASSHSQKPAGGAQSRKQFMVAPPKDISKVTKSHPKGDNDIEFSAD